MTTGAEIAGGGHAAATGGGRGPWATAFRRLRRNKSAVISTLILLIVALLCAMAPVYSGWLGADPFRSNLSGMIVIDGETVPLMQPSTTGLGLGVTPIGPTWDPGGYFLGADNQGRDVTARLLYGGRNSLLIAGASTAICLVLAAIIGVVAGFTGGITDMVLSRILDVLWAFPVYLLAISLSIVLLNSSIVIGPFTLTAGSLLLPIFIIGVIYVPYVARPIRGKVLALRESEFVLAAVGLGLPTHRILARDILPNVMPTLIVFIPTIGDYVTPELIGGGKTPMIANMVQANMLALDNRPMGSALAVTAMVIVTIVSLIFLFLNRRFLKVRQ